jgi:hypothetical protein
MTIRRYRYFRPCPDEFLRLYSRSSGGDRTRPHSGTDRFDFRDRELPSQKTGNRRLASVFLLLDRWSSGDFSVGHRPHPQVFFHQGAQNCGFHLALILAVFPRLIAVIAVMTCTFVSLRTIGRKNAKLGPSPERDSQFPRSHRRKRYNCRARRNEVTENATNTKPTIMEIPISQWVASRVHARSAMLSQLRARMAKIAPMASWNNCLNTRQSRRNPRGSTGRLAFPATVDIAAS